MMPWEFGTHLSFPCRPFCRTHRHDSYNPCSSSRLHEQYRLAKVSGRSVVFQRSHSNKSTSRAWRAHDFSKTRTEHTVSLALLFLVTLVTVIMVLLLFIVVLWRMRVNWLAPDTCTFRISPCDLCDYRNRGHDPSFPCRNLCRSPHRHVCSYSDFHAYRNHRLFVDVSEVPRPLSVKLTLLALLSVFLALQNL